MLERSSSQPKVHIRITCGPFQLQAYLTFLKPDRFSYILKIPAHSTALLSMLNKYDVLGIADYLS